MTTGSIDFPLDHSPVQAQLVYRPWSTRTLKVQLSTATATPALRIRPTSMRPEESQKGIFRAYAQNSDAFIISWGGGHEQGPCLQAEDFLMAFEKCVPLAAAATSMIYFNITHVGPAVPETALFTLEAYHPAHNDRQFATLSVTLQKPAGFSADALQFKPTETGHWQPVGRNLPIYDPRWWPREVKYAPAPASLPLVVQVDGPNLSVKWNDQLVAGIKDHTQPTVLKEESMFLELFDFDPWHVALRIWFFWLDTNVGKGHEVPDAERFDMLIRKSDGVVTLACTDLHWREVWGKVVDGPLRATLGLSQQAKMKLVREGAEKLFSVFKREAGKDHQRVYNPVERYIPRQAEALGKKTVGIERGKGAEAHIPTLANIEQSEEMPPRMTSSDVRLG